MWLTEILLPRVYLKALYVIHTRRPERTGPTWVLAAMHLYIADNFGNYSIYVGFTGRVIFFACIHGISDDDPCGNDQGQGDITDNGEEFLYASVASGVKFAQCRTLRSA